MEHGMSPHHGPCDVDAREMWFPKPHETDEAEQQNGNYRIWACTIQDGVQHSAPEMSPKGVRYIVQPGQLHGGRLVSFDPCPFEEAV